MSQKVPNTPALPRPPSTGDSRGLFQWSTDMVSRLFRILTEMSQRLNTAVMSDEPIPHVSYTVATVPDATLWEGATIYVSNETGGKTIAFSDGTNWRRVQDRAVVS